MAELKAQFAASVRTGQSPLTVSFTNTSTGSFASCLWDFGDGEHSTLIHPVHTFVQTGNFTVTLRVFGVDSSEMSYQSSIIVSSSSLATGNTQQSLSVFKNFDVGAISVSKLTVAGSTFETNAPFSAVAKSYYFYPVLATADNTQYRVLVLSAQTVSGQSFAVYKNTVTTQESNVLRTYTASTYDGWINYPLTAMLLLRGTGATAYDGDVSHLYNSVVLNYAMSGENTTLSGPYPCLFYRVLSANTTSRTIWLDRPLPKTLGQMSATLGQYLYLFGNSKIEAAAATDSEYIQRENSGNAYKSVAGVKTGLTQRASRMFIALDSYSDAHINASGLTTIATSGSPLKVSGLMKYFGYASTAHSGTAIAFIYPGYSASNSYDKLYPGTTFLNFPWIMWHGISTEMSTSATPRGLKIYDSFGTTEVDEHSGLKFRYLRDGVTSTSNVVGKVFYDKKLILLDDQELVAVLQHTSNRNWTYPPCKANLIFQNYYSPWTKSGTSYYITYRVREAGGFGSYDRWGLFSSLFPLHCRYITRVDDFSGNSAIQIEIPAQPWATGGTNCISGDPLNAFGRLWVADRLDLIIGTGTTSSTAPDPNSWRIMSGGSDGVWTNKFSGTSFILSLEGTDWCYYSGAPYSLGFSGSSTSGTSALTIGEEWLSWSYLSGQVATDIYKMSAVCIGKPNEFNATQNETWQGGSNSTYINEVGLYNENNDLLMVGKLSKPIEKNSQKFVTVKLELDL